MRGSVLKSKKARLSPGGLPHHTSLGWTVDYLTATPVALEDVTPMMVPARA